MLETKLDLNHKNYIWKQEKNYNTIVSLETAAFNTNMANKL